jgi:WD40 repeat protein
MLWYARGGKPLGTFSAGPSQFNLVLFNPTGDNVLTAGDDGSLKLWKVPEGKAARQLPNQGAPVLSAAFAPDGTRLLTGGGDGVAKVWNLGNGKLLGDLTGHTDKITSVAFSVDGAHMAGRLEQPALDMEGAGQILEGQGGCPAHCPAPCRDGKWHCTR